MIVAVDTTIDPKKAVLGPEINHPAGTQSPDDGQASARYSCLHCGNPLEYSTPDSSLFDYFTHEHQEDCISDGNMSPAHRLGEEVAGRMIYNRLLRSRHPPNLLDIERRIGEDSNFVVADLRVPDPYRLVVEIVYSTSYIDMRRRLRTMFEQRYAAMFIFLTTGRISADRVEHHLQPISSIRLGRFDPTTLDLTCGSVLGPGQIDLDSTIWETVPDYIS